MNIFYLSDSPSICAIQHCDAHVVKMCTEYGQILSTAHRVIDGISYVGKSVNNRNIKRWKFNDERENMIYKATHYNHPSVKWCRESQQNYYWLYRLFIQLLAEFRFRYEKEHACVKLISYLSLAPKNIEWKPFTEPTPAMDNKYITPNDSISSYRTYYRCEKVHLHSWKKREIPSWILE